MQEPGDRITPLSVTPNPGHTVEPSGELVRSTDFSRAADAGISEGGVQIAEPLFPA